MRGSIRKRYKDSWNIIIDVGYQVDPDTGKQKRVQKWFSVKGTKRDAEKKLAELLHNLHRSEYVEPSKRTVGEWLHEWLETAIKPPNKRLRTYETYKSVIERHLKPAFGHVRLQQLKPTDIKRYYNEASLSPTTLEQHHTLLHSALKAAQLQGLVQRNVASLVIGKPHRREGRDDILRHCWEVEEARLFIAAAKEQGPQPAAFYTLALDTGARKGELCGLKWIDLDLDTGTLAIVRQLIKPGPDPMFGPLKSGESRTISIAPETVTLLRRHKAHQAELKLANRTHYHDHGLVFAKEWEHLRRHGGTLGHPLQMNNIGQNEYRRIIQAAGVRPIKLHGLRHTCATLLLQASVPIKVVQERLGHKKIEITLNIYAHALPSMQQDAAAKLAALIHS
jgi:integrase